MNHFKLLGHLDTFAVTATLLKNKHLLTDGTLLLWSPAEGEHELFESWKSLNSLIAKLRQLADSNELYGDIWIDRLQPGTATDFTCEVNPQYLTFIVPLVTNPYVREYARDEMVHAPVGALLWANAGVHRASANWGEFPRYHLNVQIKEGVKA